MSGITTGSQSHGVILSLPIPQDGNSFERLFNVSVAQSQIDTSKPFEQQFKDRVHGLLLDGSIFQHISNQERFAGGDYKKALFDMVDDFSVALAAGFSRLAVTGIVARGKMFNLNEVLGVSLDIRTGSLSRTVVLNHRLEKFLGGVVPNSNGITWKELLNMANRLREQSSSGNLDSAALDGFFKLVEQVTNQKLQSRDLKVALDVLQSHLEKSLQIFFKELLYEKLAEEYVHSKRTPEDVVRFFDSKNLRPFRLEIELSGELLTLEIPSSDISLEGVSPASDNLGVLFGNQLEAKLANLCLWALPVIAQLLLEYKLAKDKGVQYFPGDSKLKDWFDQLLAEYDQDSQQAAAGGQAQSQAQPLSRSVNIFSWLKQRLENKSFRETFGENIIRLLGPGFVFEKLDGVDNYFVPYLKMSSAGASTMVLLYQNSDVSAELETIFKRYGVQRGVQQDIRQDVLKLLELNRVGADVSFFGLNMRTERDKILQYLGIRGLLDAPVNLNLDNLENLSQDRLQADVESGRLIFSNSQHANTLTRLYARFRLNIGQNPRVAFNRSLQQGRITFITQQDQLAGLNQAGVVNLSNPVVSKRLEYDPLRGFDLIKQ